MKDTEKTLAQMTAEVVGNNTAKGWYEKKAETILRFQAYIAEHSPR